MIREAVCYWFVVLGGTSSSQETGLRWYSNVLVGGAKWKQKRGGEQMKRWGRFVHVDSFIRKRRLLHSNLTDVLACMIRMARLKNDIDQSTSIDNYDHYEPNMNAFGFSILGSLSTSFIIARLSTGPTVEYCMSFIRETSWKALIVHDSFISTSIYRAKVWSWCDTRREFWPSCTNTNC